jgi:hypothetical protein
MVRGGATPIGDGDLAFTTAPEGYFFTQRTRRLRFGIVRQASSILTQETLEKRIRVSGLKERLRSGPRQRNWQGIRPTIYDPLQVR